MKKYGLEQYLKRSKIIWKKNISKKIILKAKLAAGAASKKPPLSSILATIGVNTEAVVNTFNEQTAGKFTKELLLPTIIKVSPNKAFALDWKLPTVYDLYKEAFNKKLWVGSEYRNQKILAAYVYKASIAKQQKLKKIYKGMRQIYGSLKSWDIYQLADHEKDKKRFKKKK